MTLLNGRNHFYLLLAALIVTALLAVGWASYAEAQEGSSETEDAENTSMTIPEEPASNDDVGVPYDGPSGIWVSGAGKASGAPDIAVVSMGVESVEETAAAARSNAAAAMQSVMDAITGAGVADADIHTRYFNISPRYQSVEIERCDNDNGEESEGMREGSEGMPEGTGEKTCYTVWESRLIGYAVSNQATVKIRDLDDVGTIIDQATEAAGNLVRINGISFDIEDPQALQDEARADAVADMMRKAEMLAELSGAKLGRLVYLTEGAAYIPPQPLLYARAEAALVSTDASTSISPGELDVSATVQGVFMIAGTAEPEEE